MVILSLLIVLVFGLLLFICLRIWRKQFILPIGDVLYADTKMQPGNVLYAQTIPLAGKPDYILRQKGSVIPVEIKRGKTPREPFPSHIAQLYAYCILIKEEYNLRPPYGIIKYPDKEFQLGFPEHVEEHMIQTIQDMLKKKTNGVSRAALKLTCRECRSHIA